MLLPEKTDVQKSNKLYYKLILWSYALIVAISYTTGKISGNNQPSDAVYSVIVLLVAIERMLNCYKELNIMYEKGIKI